MNYKFICVNEIETISFHDCVIEKVELKEKNLYWYLDRIDVLPENPLNPYPVAKQTDAAIVCFENFEQVSAFWYDDSTIPKGEIDLERYAEKRYTDVETLSEAMELLAVNLIEMDSRYRVKIEGDVTRPPYCTAYMEFDFDRVQIGWNEWVCDSWFVR